MTERWTWDGPTESVEAAFAGPVSNSDWCDSLDLGVVGKVRCACAGLAVARAVVGASGADPVAEATLELLAQWIDDPSDERFDLICSLIFPADQSPELGPCGIAWWALRVATSATDCGEAGWALGAACDAAVRAGFDPAAVRLVARQEVMARHGSAAP